MGKKEVPQLKSVKQNSKKEEKPVFDPTKSYIWQHDLPIEITGKEFEMILRALQANLQENQFQAHIMQYDALMVVQSILKRNVEDGTITERETPQE